MKEKNSREANRGKYMRRKLYCRKGAMRNLAEAAAVPGFYFRRDCAACRHPGIGIRPDSALTIHCRRSQVQAVTVLVFPHLLSLFLRTICVCGRCRHRRDARTSRAARPRNWRRTHVSPELRKQPCHATSGGRDTETGKAPRGRPRFWRSR
jgi:hypothetical protein